ncbi:MAG: hypothetical protein WBA74_25530 [Cyclobacteriaceae bacterium]
MSESKSKIQVETILRDLGQKIDALIEEAKDSTGSIREELEEKIELLKKKRDELDESFDTYREKGKDKWEEAKPHLSKAAAELKSALDKLFK